MLFLICFPFLAALGVGLLRRRGRTWRNRYVQIVPAIELAAALLLLAFPDAALTLPDLCGVGLSFAAGSLQTLLALLTALLWTGTGLNSPSYFAHAEHASRFYTFWLLTLGALMGVFLAADLFTLFVFFEMMSLTSYVWVAQNETPAALRAGQAYLAVAVLGGMALLAGLLLLQDLLGTLVLDQLSAAVRTLPETAKPRLYVAGGCCLVGFGAKAGMFPLHIWLPKAHPAAPAPASALLSGILTKSGIFGVLIVSRYLFWTDLAWNRVILVLGTITMVLGAVLALFSLDLKRTLACSSMSQIGFILLGVAMQGFLPGENAPAAWGTVLHMLNHALIKLVLFVSAGVIYENTHTLDLNELRGWGRGKQLLKLIFFIGAASIAGVPGFSGYVSKTLLHEGIVEHIHSLQAAGQSAAGFQVIEVLFLFSGGLTAAYMLKLCVTIFGSPRPSGQRPAVQRYMSPETAWALSAAAGAMVLLGCLPGITMEPIAQWAGVFLAADPGHPVHYFTWTNLQGALISLGAGAVFYMLLVRSWMSRRMGGERLLVNRWPEGWDLEDRLYRPLLKGLHFAGSFLARVLASMGSLVVLAGERLLFTGASSTVKPGEDANFGRYLRKPRRYPLETVYDYDQLAAGAGLAALLLYLLCS